MEQVLLSNLRFIRCVHNLTSLPLFWPPVLKPVHCQTRRTVHCSRIRESSERKKTPSYNYGLSGKGKTDRYIWKKLTAKQQQHQQHTEGEVLFGIHPITMALTSHHRQRLHSLYIDSKHKGDKSSGALRHIQHLASQRNIPVQFVPKSTLMLMSGNRPHQGVCLDASPRILPPCDLQELSERSSLNPNELWLLLFNVQDPMNFGAVLRSSYFLGVDRIIVPSTNSCAPSPVVSKASAGALEVMDIQQIDGTYRSIRQLTQAWQSHGGQVAGTASQADSVRQVVDLQDLAVSTPSPTLLIVGNEGSGIDADVLDLCDTLLTITCPGHKDSAAGMGVSSLNVSVATGILIHWLRSSRSNSR